MKKCPFCAEEIQSEAIKCRYCGEFLSENKNNVEVVCMLVSLKNKESISDYWNDVMEGASTKFLVVGRIDRDVADTQGNHSVDTSQKGNIRINKTDYYIEDCSIFYEPVRTPSWGKYIEIYALRNCVEIIDGNLKLDDFIIDMDHATFFIKKKSKEVAYKRSTF